MKDYTYVRLICNFAFQRTESFGFFKAQTLENLFINAKIIAINKLARSFAEITFYRHFSLRMCVW